MHINLIRPWWTLAHEGLQHCWQIVVLAWNHHTKGIASVSQEAAQQRGGGDEGAEDLLGERGAPLLHISCEHNRFASRLLNRPFIR